MRLPEKVHTVCIQFVHRLPLFGGYHWYIYARGAPSRVTDVHRPILYVYRDCPYMIPSVQVGYRDCPVPSVHRVDLPWVPCTVYRYRGIPVRFTGTV